jgi:hypothetical protein
MSAGRRRRDPFERSYGTDEGFRWLAETKQGKGEGTEGVKTRKTERKACGSISGLEVKRLSMGYDTVVGCHWKLGW